MYLFKSFQRSAVELEDTLPAVMHLDTDFFPPLVIDIAGIKNGLLLSVGQCIDTPFRLLAHPLQLFGLRNDLVLITLQTDLLISRIRRFTAGHFL